MRQKDKVMSGARIPKVEEAFPVRVDAKGRKLCRWDQAIIPKGRRTFCGKKNCIHEVSMRTNPGYLRRLVFRRDKGVCGKCGCDTPKLWSVMSHAASAYREIGKREPYFEWHWEAVWQVLAAIGFNRRSDAALWEADHVVEVVRGGDSCLENMQTLCIPCHKLKTKQLAGARAGERRDTMRQLQS